MTKDEAEKMAHQNKTLVGQRWRNNASGEIETVIDVIAKKLRNVDYAWAVVAVFIPKADNITVTTREHFLDSFFDNFTKLN